eukprot:scaffold2119_cov264-Pinguiococcus_pyrenoidosus.AAC.7
MVGSSSQRLMPRNSTLRPSDPPSDPSHDKVGPKPSTFSGQRALDFVLQNQEWTSRESAASRPKEANKECYASLQSLCVFCSAAVSSTAFALSDEELVWFDEGEICAPLHSLMTSSVLIPRRYFTNAGFIISCERGEKKSTASEGAVLGIWLHLQAHRVRHSPSISCAWAARVRRLALRRAAPARETTSSLTEDLTGLLHDGVPVVVSEVADRLEAHVPHVAGLQLLREDCLVQAKDSDEAVAQHEKEPEDRLQEPREQVVEQQRHKCELEAHGTLDAMPVAGEVLEEEGIEKHLQQHEDEDPREDSIQVAIQYPVQDAGVDHTKSHGGEQEADQHEAEGSAADGNADVHRHPPDREISGVVLAACAHSATLQASKV